MSNKSSGSRGSPGHDGRLHTQILAVVLWLIPLGVMAALPAALFLLDVPLGHLPRYLLACLFLALALSRFLNLTCRLWQKTGSFWGRKEFHPAICFHPERTWPGRLGGLVFWGGLATAVWWFLPPLGEVNLWSAREEAVGLAARLDNLRPGDREGLQKEEARRLALKKNFPELAWFLKHAEDNWARRTDEAIADLTARVGRVQKEIHALWREKQYAEMRMAVDRLWVKFHEEAESLGEGEALNNFCNWYRTAGLLKDRAGKPVPGPGTGERP
jgi:hypothetical protein